MNDYDQNNKDEFAVNDRGNRDEALTTADVAAATRRQTDREVPADDVRRIDDRDTTIDDRDTTDERSATRGNGEQLPDEGFAPLFDEGTLSEFQTRWSSVQTGFVDDPRAAVEQADQLVAAVMKQLAEVFANERANLESDWSEGQDVSTEELRLAFRRYRSFFDRLLSV